MAAARSGRADIFVLVSLATVAAAALGEWGEAAAVSALFLISLVLERYSTLRSQQGAAALLKLRPNEVRLVRRDGSITNVAPETIVPGDVVRVLPGERVAVDAVVQSGTSDVDAAVVTGESRPHGVALNDDVLAGSLVLDGALELRAKQGAEESTLGRIARAVRKAQQRRSPRELTIDRFARWYTPVVIAASLAVMIVPSIFQPSEATTWVMRGLAVMLTACPCSLVLATPAATSCGLGAAASAGVLVKSGAALETAASVTAVVFDKTGTLNARTIHRTVLARGA